jgi:hypothetical protein
MKRSEKTLGSSMPIYMEITTQILFERRESPPKEFSVSMRNTSWALNTIDDPATINV